MNTPKFRSYFYCLLITDVLFTAIDSVIHFWVEALEVYYYPIPAFLLEISSSPLFWYAVGKFFGTLFLGLILFYFVKKGRNTFMRTLILTLPTVLLLEARYIISGNYATDWHVYNLIMHSLVLFVSSYFVLSKTKLFESNVNTK